MTPFLSAFNGLSKDKKLLLSQAATNGEFKSLLHEAIAASQIDLMKLRPDFSAPLKTLQEMQYLQQQIDIYTDILKSLDTVVDLFKKST